MKTGKRLCSVFLALVMALTILPIQTFAAGFQDISGHWARENIEDAVERGYFSGTSEPHFRPIHP